MVHRLTWFFTIFTSAVKTPMYKKITQIGCLCALLLTACAGTAVPAETVTPAALTQDTLTVYNWAEYIDPQIISNFEEKYSVKINYVTFESSTELVDEVKNSPGAYDVIVATDFMVMVMRRESLLAPLDKGNIPNIKNLDPFLENPQYDPGNRYCLPYQWGTTGIGYNRAATGRDIISWGDLFDSQFQGRVTMMDTGREMLGNMLLYLGYSPNTTKAEEIHQARDLLIGNSSQFLSFEAFDGYLWLSEGTADIVVEYSGAVMRSMLRDPDVQYAIPKEGAIIWTDNLCISAASQKRELAEAFINYLYEPEPGALLSNYVLYASPNLAALPYIDETHRNSPIMYPPEETRRRLFYLVDVGAEAEQLYQDAWLQVLAAHGK